MHAIEGSRGPLFPGGPRAESFQEGDALLGWRHVPGVTLRYNWPEHPDGHVTIAINGLGLREDLATRRTPSPGVHRILVLGDSHTDGLVNNAESWPNVLERSLQMREGEWEVLNAGVTGYQPHQYYLWWRTLGRQLAPEVVLLGYYLGNDLLEAAGHRLQRREDGRWALDESIAENVPMTGSGPADWLVGVRERCRLCAISSFVAHRTVLAGPTFEEVAYVRGADAEHRRRYVSALRHCLGCVWQSLDQRWLLDDDPVEYLYQLDATEELFRRMRDEVREADGRLVVVVIPSKLQIESGAATRAREAAMLLGIEDIHPLFEDRVEADVVSLLDRLGIETIAVRDALTAEHTRASVPVYYEVDWHLNVDGSRVVGETVGAAFRQMMSR